MARTPLVTEANRGSVKHLQPGSMLFVRTTGSASGVGHAIVRARAMRLPDERYLLGARNQANGYEAPRRMGEGATDVVRLGVIGDESVAAVEKLVTEEWVRAM